MPITTPANMIETYGDPDHFNHVLEHLHIPAVEKAGYKAIEPEAKGADLIHGRIIGQLQKADLVLCDMSALNANVFFELGIRTAQNLPICLIKDNKTDHIPFDTSIINRHEYNCDMRAWVLDKEISKLAQHITDSSKHTENEIWKSFAVSIDIKPIESDNSTASKLDIVTKKLDSLIEKENIEKSHSSNIKDDMLIKESLRTRFQGISFLFKNKGDGLEVYIKSVSPELYNSIEDTIITLMTLTNRKIFLYSLEEEKGN